MILWLHRLRREEEGQTLVLGAVFGIILALCVLGTVNMGRAVYDKIQLQTACDNGAYSQAAVEARVINMTAYTNRAMVVHYSSIMAMSAYLTWLHFVGAFVQAIIKGLSLIPIATAAANAINQAISFLFKILDYAVSYMTPIVAAANMVLYLLQEGAWYALYVGRLLTIPPEAHSGDSNGDPYRPIWPVLLPAANAAVFSQSRGNALMPINTVNAAKIFINSGDPAVQEARLHMVEIANSAREPWVAYGDNYNANFVLSPFARHFILHGTFFCNAQISTNARTELGTWPRQNTISSIYNTTGEVYSGDRLEAALHCKILFINISVLVSFFDLQTIDQGLNVGTAQSNHNGLQLKVSPGILKAPIMAGLAALGLVAAAGIMNAYASTTPIQSDSRRMWISPYVYFSPSTKAGPSGGLAAVVQGAGLGNFGQPDVIFGLAKERADINRNKKVFGSKVKSILGGSTHAGSVDFEYTQGDVPQVPGFSGQSALHTGYNTFCAAQAYYHRPGDWREMPNFFNPLWSARLMPVMDSNAASSLGTTLIPGLGQLLLH
jgi:hypothetical protein